jgi:uncharacterized membrane protein
MITMLVGMLIFFAMHSVAIVAPGFRDARIAAWGAGRWKLLYSLVSLVGFVLMIRGYSMLRFEPQLLYVPPAGLRHLAALLMLPVFSLLLATYLPGRIKRLAKHPMLLAVKLWALSHLLANGMLADVLLFGGFLVWAVLDRISLKRRAVPAPASAPAAASGGIVNDAIVVVGGLVLYVVFVKVLHEWLFGVAPFG